MALILTMREGFTVSIGGDRYEVQEVHTAFTFTVVREADGKRFHVNDSKWVWIDEGVSLKAGIPLKDNGSLVRLMIRAPQEVLIVRGYN